MQRILIYITVILTITFTAVFAQEQKPVPEPLIDTGALSADMINDKLGGLKDVTLPQYRIKSISEMFLGTPYGGGTLQSNDGEQEHLVVDFTSLDCFTFLDYVEALRLSQDFDGFVNNLRYIRYKDGDISFLRRNHFFTDWAQTKHVADVTKLIGGEHTLESDKMLNETYDERAYVPGVPSVERKIFYIPAHALIEYNLADKLQTGDYVGFYTDKPGLDVTHVGIIIHDGNRLTLRHASSRKTNMKVVDQDFTEYLKHVKGIIVLRPVINP